MDPSRGEERRGKGGEEGGGGEGGGGGGRGEGEGGVGGRGRGGREGREGRGGRYVHGVIHLYTVHGGIIFLNIFFLLYFSRLIGKYGHNRRVFVTIENELHLVQPLPEIPTTINIIILCT